MSCGRCRAGGCFIDLGALVALVGVFSLRFYAFMDCAAAVVVVVVEVAVVVAIG